jgi:hypothetical protein
MSRSVAFVIACSTLALLLAIVSAGGAQDTDPGERLMNAACQDCHSVRVIQVQAMDADGWTKRISQEIEKGAKLSKEDVPTLVEYLVRTHGPMPDGPGREVILNICTLCHDLYRIKENRRSPEEWEELLVSMLNEGAPLNDEQFARVHLYLSRNFGIE